MPVFIVDIIYFKGISPGYGLLVGIWQDMMNTCCNQSYRNIGVGSIAGHERLWMYGYSKNDKCF